MEENEGKKRKEAKTENEEKKKENVGKKGVNKE